MLKKPSITVIMPIRNEEGYISNALQAVLQQDYPLEQMQILVVNGMSTDQTRPIVKNFQEKFPNIELIDNPGRIVPIGLNIAIQKAKGDILVRVDGHCIIAPDYVSNCVKHLEQESVAGVGGPMETIGETYLAQGIAIAMSSDFGVGGSAFRTKQRRMYVETVAFPAYPREVVERAGLFDEEMVRNQDDEYNYRLLQLGEKLLLSPDVRSRYYSRSSFKSLWRQYFQYGYWKVRVMQKHPRQLRARQFVPPLFVAGLALLILLALFRLEGLYLLGMVVGAYLLANLSAAVLTSARRGWSYLPVLPLAFAILHVAYGAGFLVGLVKFANRWKLSTTSQA